MARCPSCDHENRDGAQFCEVVRLAAGNGHRTRGAQGHHGALLRPRRARPSSASASTTRTCTACSAAYHDLCRSLITVARRRGREVHRRRGRRRLRRPDRARGRPERAVRAALRMIDEIAASSARHQGSDRRQHGRGARPARRRPRVRRGLRDRGHLEHRRAARSRRAGDGRRRRREDPRRDGRDDLVRGAGEPVDAKGKAEPVPAWRALHPISRDRKRRPRSVAVRRSGARAVDADATVRAFKEAVGGRIRDDRGGARSRESRDSCASSLDTPTRSPTWSSGARGDACRTGTGSRSGPWRDRQSTRRDLGDRRSGDARRQDRSGRARGRRAGPPVATRPPRAVGRPRTSTVAPHRKRRSRLGVGSWNRWPPTRLRSSSIEDLHWADDAFVGFLEHLADRVAGMPLLIVVTARPEIEERHPSWLPELATRRCFRSDR